MTINYKQIISFSGLAVCIALAILTIPTKWLILSIICEICIVLALDPYRFLWLWFPPVSIALMVSSIILVTFAVYTHINAWAIFIPALIAVLMIIGIIRFNKEWLSKYRFNASQSVKTALVSDEETEYNEAWYSYGRRECDTLMREYLYKAVSINDLECVYKHIYAIGYIDGTDSRADSISDLTTELDRLEKEYINLKRNSVSLVEYNNLQTEFDKMIDEGNELRQMLYDDTSEVNLWRSRYFELNREYELLLSEEQEPPKPQDGSIIEIPTLEERIIRDREDGATYGELAEKYNKTKSQIQYILRKSATA